METLGMTLGITLGLLGGIGIAAVLKFWVFPRLGIKT
jgi:hypothetical protein